MVLYDRLLDCRTTQWTIVLLFLASSASSQTTTSVSTAAKECSSACDSQYNSGYARTLQTVSLPTFLASHGNSTKQAADDACRTLGDAVACYQSCDSRFPNYPSMALSSKVAEAKDLNFQFCLTPNDETSCRLMDSYYCEAFYNKRSCGVSLEKFKSCVIDTQLVSNKCSLTEISTWSQKNVQWYIATAVQYCAVNTKAVSDAVTAFSTAHLDDEARKLQACTSIVTKVCFGDFSSSGTQLSYADRYLNGNLGCSVFSSAESCLWKTLNGTHAYMGKSYYAACTNLPNNVSAISSLVIELRKLTPKTCLATNATMGQSGVTSRATTNQPITTVDATDAVPSKASTQQTSTQQATTQQTTTQQITTQQITTQQTTTQQRAMQQTTTQETPTVFSVKETTPRSIGHQQLPSEAAVLVFAIAAAFFGKAR